MVTESQRARKAWARISLNASWSSWSFSSSSARSAFIRSWRLGSAIDPRWLLDKQLKLGLDLKGGVHLVLRVQTDDALRLETQTEMERLREELLKRRRDVHVDQRAPHQPSSSSKASPPAQDALFRQVATEVQANFDRASGVGGSYTLHDEAEHRRHAASGGGRPGAPDDRAPRQRARRGRADHRASRAATAIRSSCSCRA